jgi:hypothetical protein
MIDNIELKLVFKVHEIYIVKHSHISIFSITFAIYSADFLLLSIQLAISASLFPAKLSLSP